MELLKRYLYAVRSYLPQQQRDDVVRELSDSIQSQAEERAAELGRALTADEQSAILKQYGHPMLAASRYQPERFLIGPALFPFYWRVLTIVLGIVLGLNLVGLTISLAMTHSVGQLPMLWGSLWSALLISFGAVTLCFAAWERGPQKSRALEAWNPRSLPSVRDGQPIPRLRSVAALMLYLMLFLWLLNAAQIRTWSFGGLGVVGHSPFELAPSVSALYWTYLGATFVLIVINCLNAVRPDWLRLRAATYALVNAALLSVACWVLLTTHVLVSLVSRLPHPAGLATGATALNWSAFGVLIIVSIAYAVELFRNLRILFRGDDDALLNFSQKGTAI